MATLPQYKTDGVSTSNFDLSHRFRSSMTSGIIYPILNHRMLPGEKIKLGIASSLKTLQTLAPVLGSCAVQFEIYFSRLSDYVNIMSENDGGFSDADLPLPSLGFHPHYLTQAARDHAEQDNGIITYPRLPIIAINEWGNIQYRESFTPSAGVEATLGVISPSSLWSYLDYGSGYFYSSKNGYDADREYTIDTPFDALPFLQYLDIIRNYFANPQEPDVPCFGIGHNYTNAIPGGWSVNGKTGRPTTHVSLTELDTFFRLVRSNYDIGIYDVLKAWNAATGLGLDSGYGLSAEELCDHFSGLFCATHFADMFNGRLNSTKVDEFVKQAKVQVTDGSFTVDTLRFANKLSRVLNLSLFSGGRFDDWQRSLWSVKPNSHLRIPQFIGSFTQDISFDEIVSTSGSATGESKSGEGLGAVAGRIDDYKRSQYHYFEADTYGNLMVVATIIPRIGYSNNISRHSLKTNLNDWYLPQYDRLGFQDVFRCEVTALPPIGLTHAYSSAPYYMEQTKSLEEYMKVSIGKQPAWIEYMTATDRIRGQFSEETGLLDYWTIQNDYIRYRNVADGSYIPQTDLLPLAVANSYPTNGYVTEFSFSSYINPAAFNHLFPDQSRGAENFYLQVAFDLQSNKEKSKNALPKL